MHKQTNKQTNHKPWRILFFSFFFFLQRVRVGGGCLDLPPHPNVRQFRPSQQQPFFVVVVGVTSNVAGPIFCVFGSLRAVQHSSVHVCE